MLTLIIGGAASGKSEFAESLVTRLEGRRVYIATMEPYDDECRARIRRHRELRRQKGFYTVEQYVDLGAAEVPADANALLEDLPNLLANERYSPAGQGAERVLSGIGKLSDICRHLTVVTGDLFSGGSGYAGDTWGYLKDLAWLHREIAARADLVVEVSVGLPNVVKGVLP